MNLRSFIPSITAAKRAKIPLPSSKAPEEQVRMAALVVDIEVLQREVWTERTFLSRGDYAALRNQPPSAGRSGAVYHVASLIFREYPAGVQCQVDHYYDKRVALSEVVTPRELAVQLTHLDEALHQVCMGQRMPEALRCMDLTPKARGGAYRAAATEKAPDFHGHSFGRALEDAKQVANQVLRRGTPVGGEIRVYALPLLHCRYAAGKPDVVLFYGPDGRLHACSGGTEE
ncbi:MAG: hypothetical protein AAGA56_18055 [Myxococcota bacterium]